MPISLKQLDLRYEDVCNNISDAREYTMQHLSSNIQLDVSSFYTDLESSNLVQLEEGMKTIEEVIQQCRVAIKNENSRRIIKEKICSMTSQHSEKIIRKHHFKQNRRKDRLTKASPYPKQSSSSIEEH